MVPPQKLTKALVFNDVQPLVTFVRLDVRHNLTAHDDMHQLRQVVAPYVRHLPSEHGPPYRLDRRNIIDHIGHPSVPYGLLTRKL